MFGLEVEVDDDDATGTEIMGAGACAQEKMIAVRFVKFGVLQPFSNFGWP